MIFLILSMCGHFALLSLPLRKDAGGLPGEGFAVSQVSRSLTHFVPSKPEMGKVTLTKDSVVNSQLENNPLPREPIASQPQSVQKPIAEIVKSKPIVEVVQIFESPVISDVAIDLNREKQPKLQQPSEGVSSAVNPALTVTSEEGVSRSDARPVAFISPQTSAVPRYADNPRPNYPDVARRKGWTGEVRLLVRVDELGQVARIAVDHSSGYSALDRAARRTVRRWTFVPATENGIKVASEVVVPVDFRLPAKGKLRLSQ